MNKLTRRNLLSIGAMGAVGSVAACTTGVTYAIDTNRVDSEVAGTLDSMYQQFPDTRELVTKARGVLVMPAVRKAGLIVGGAYGEGALLIGSAPVDYYTFTSASFGLQAGFQKTRHVLFILTSEALARFRLSSGFVAGGDIDYALPAGGDGLSLDTNQIKKPIYAVVFDQTGVSAGASLAGSKYTRVVR